MIRKLSVIIVLLLVSAAIAQDAATLRGTVLDAGKIVLPGASVKILEVRTGKETASYSASDGKFEFNMLEYGTYVLSVEMPGFQSITLNVDVQPGKIQNLEIVLPEEQRLSEDITVSADQDPLLNKEEAQTKEELGEVALEYTPMANQRFQDALPLVPSVVRGPDGTININGARATESSLLVNGSNVTDPVTGNFAIELPIEAVENVQVYTNPYSAEYGKFTGGVTNVSTKSGGDDFKIEFNDFMPRLHFTDGLKTEGVEAWKPRVRISGPTGINKLYFSQALHYKYLRTFLEDLPSGRNEIKLNAFDTLTQFDYKMSPTHEMTFTFSMFPETTRNVNLNTFLPVDTTPDFEQDGFNVAASDRYIFKNGSFLEGGFSYKSYDVMVTPKQGMEGLFRLTPDGASGNYFNKQERDSARAQWTGAYTLKPVSFNGTHVFRIGADLGKTTYDGQLSYLPIEIRRADGTLYERIRFAGDGIVGTSSTELSTYLQDHWIPTEELTVDWGLRLDYDSISEDTNFAPRLAAAYSPKRLPYTVFKAGIGLFYDKVYLSARDFERYPNRVVDRFDRNGNYVSSETWKNELAEDLRTPRSTTWNIEVDQQLTSRLVVRTNFLMRHGKNQFLLEPLDGVLMLNNGGHSRYWEWEFTSQYRLSHENSVNISYVRSQTKGDTNDFDSYLGNFQKPVIRENEFTELAFDTPNRFLLWGVMQLPYRFYVSPVLEIRNGFPYSKIDETQQYVGPRNTERFPLFSQLDLRITRTFKVLGKYNIRAGMKIFNVLDKFNPRDVQNNINSDEYGTFYNGVGRTFRGTFEIEY